jgi:hypothetical protein
MKWRRSIFWQMAVTVLLFSLAVTGCGAAGSAPSDSKTEYVIRIGMMAMFDHQMSDNEGFSLTLADGNVSYRYDGCNIVGRKTRLDGNDMATEEFTLKADQMTKQVTENE